MEYICFVLYFFFLLLLTRTGLYMLYIQSQKTITWVSVLWWCACFNVCTTKNVAFMSSIQLNNEILRQIFEWTNYFIQTIKRWTFCFLYFITNEQIKSEICSFQFKLHLDGTLLHIHLLSFICSSLYPSANVRFNFDESVDIGHCNCNLVIH